MWPVATYQIFTHSWARQKNKTNNNRTTDDDSCLPAVRTRCDAGWSHPRAIRRNERFTITQAYFYNDSPIDEIYLIDNSNPQFPFNSIKEKCHWYSNFKYANIPYAIVDSDSPSLYLYIGVNPLVLLSNLTFTQNIPHPHRKNRKNIWLTLEKLRTAWIRQWILLL